jgi:hypothetical protein
MAAGYTLDPDETVINRIDRHWIDMVPITFAALLIAGAGLAILYFLPTIGDQFSAVAPPGIVAGLGTVLVGLAGLIFLAGYWIYRQNYLLITNLHLIKCEQNGLFGRNITQLGLSRVQNVTGRRKGVLGAMFDYGDFEVETERTQDNFTFRNSPQPEALADRALQMHEDFIRRNPGREIP